MTLWSKNNTLKLILYYSIFSVIIIGINSCNGCSKSRIQRNRLKNKSEVFRGDEVNIIPMIRDNSGIYQIPILVNGVKMYFVFDTGASLISISNVEAIFLYKQGKLTKEDILGNQKFSDANGDISVGTIINLKEISIGKRILYNVKATVVDNSNAPLLFGQSALAQFGKISIDYKKQVLVFE